MARETTQAGSLDDLQLLMPKPAPEEPPPPPAGPEEPIQSER